MIHQHHTGLRLFLAPRIAKLEFTLLAILGVMAYLPEDRAAGHISLPTPALICTSTNEKTWTSVSGLCHMLMYYGLGKTDLPDFPTGRALLKPLVDQPTAIKVFGESPFITTRNGVRYTLLDDPAFHLKVGEAHRDQCLATFAQLDLPLDTPVRLKARNYSIADVLSEAVANFDLNEREPAWTAIALVKYLPPKKKWVNRFGERSTFTQLVQHLLHVDPNTQSCGGTHLLEALGLIAEADHHSPILEKQMRKRLNTYLTRTLHEIVRRQATDGSWSKRWCPAAHNDQTGQMTMLVPTTRRRALMMYCIGAAVGAASTLAVRTLQKRRLIRSRGSLTI